MSTIRNQRLTSTSDEPVVVFLIGMRVNRWWKVWQWLRTARAMPRMLRELAQHPELGMLGSEAWFGRTTLMVSYWKSMDHLFGYAKLRNAEHLPAWRAFNQLVGTSGDVGIWHETYLVQAGAYENADFGARHQDKRQGWRGPEWRLDGTARATFLARQKKLYGADPLVAGKRYGPSGSLSGANGSPAAVEALLQRATLQRPCTSHLRGA